MAKKKILIVDDEPDVRGSIKAILEEAGYTVQEAASGEDALKKLKKNSGYDLVLVDHFMPGMTGRKLCEKIRMDAQLKNLKLAFLTVAKFGKAGMEELKNLNILDYIQKPFDNKDLVERVKKMLG